MPEKYLEFWANLWNLVPEPVRIGLFGFLVAFLRANYDESEPRRMRRLLEAGLCGTIAYAISTAVEHFGIPQGLSVIIGGAVGLYGADKVREIGRRVAEKRINEKL